MTHPVNVKEIMAGIRARIEKRTAPQKLLGSPISSQDMGEAQLEEAFRTLESASSRMGKVPPAPPTLRGRVGAFLVKIVHRALFLVYTPNPRIPDCDDSRC